MKQQDINRRGKLEHLTAQDMFQGPGTLQVFSAKSGKWIGTVNTSQGEAVREKEQQELIAHLEFLKAEREREGQKLQKMWDDGIRPEDGNHYFDWLAEWIGKIDKMIEEIEQQITPQQSEQQATDPAQMKLF